MLILALVALGVFWLYRFNSALRSTPEEARKFSPKRWTKEQVKEAYENVKKNPVNFLKHVPPAQERRYIIVGGSGKFTKKKKKKASKYRTPRLTV